MPATAAPLAVVVALFGGVLTWSFMEYVLHRFLGHDRRTMPNFFSVEHTRHHSEGDYFAPSWKKAVSALVFSVGMFTLTSLVVPPVVGATYTASFVAAYVAYEVVHRRAHTHEGFGRYGRFLRRHHFHHHFANPRANHGVTSPGWDFVFGTWEPATEIRVPEKLAMRWLVDPSTGDAWPRFAGHYRIVASRHPETAEGNPDL